MRTSWILWYAIILHFVWGIMLLADNSASWVTATHHLTDVLGGRYSAAAALLIVSMMATVGMYRNVSTFLEIFWLIPQQLFLVMSAFGAMKAIHVSAFADGVVRPQAFIAADQFPAILTAVLHTFAIIEIYVWRTWKR